MEGLTMLSTIWGIAPLIVVSLGALILLLVDVFMPKGAKEGQLDIRESVTLLTLLIALFAGVGQVVEVSGGDTIIGRGALFVDSFSWFSGVLVIGAALLAALMGIAYVEREGIAGKGEYYFLYLSAVAGGLVMLSAAEFTLFFIGLEIMSLALYGMCASSVVVNGPAMVRSSEAAIKYFVLGSFSSAFLLYGIALLYGLSGSTEFAKIAEVIPSGPGAMVCLAFGLVLIGLIFKIGGAPFHFWVPDVYQGAPTPVTAFMACVVKIIAVGATLRILWSLFQPEIFFWSGAVWLISFTTMVVGNLLALKQRSLKRMLAYSSVAHAGYMLMAILAPGTSYGGGAAILFYLVAYGVSTLGALGIVLYLSSPHVDSPHPDDITRLNGLSKRSPLLAGLMALFMFALAGLPPGVAGMVGKLYLFSAAVKANYVGLAIVGALASAVSCYYYLRVVVAMYFVESDEPAPSSFPLTFGAALAICGIASIMLGIFPDTLYQEAELVAKSLIR